MIDETAPVFPGGDPPQAGRGPDFGATKGYDRRKTKKVPRGSAQAFEKARFGQGNPRKSKPFSWSFLGPAWLGFAGFG
jgi:hypothetical protein